MCVKQTRVRVWDCFTAALRLVVVGRLELNSVVSVLRQNNVVDTTRIKTDQIKPPGSCGTSVDTSCRLPRISFFSVSSFNEEERGGEVGRVSRTRKGTETNVSYQGTLICCILVLPCHEKAPHFCVGGVVIWADLPACVFKHERMICEEADRCRKGESKVY